MENKEQKILEAAEEMVRLGGYNSFSFREVAKTVGIKSSSVHYHFPTKADLGAAVARFYTEKFLQHLGDPEELLKNSQDPIQHYIEACRNAVTVDKRMCLCGLLGAEVNCLPEQVITETKAFFTKNIEWLTNAYKLKGTKKNPKAIATLTLSLLEGAMIISNVEGNVEAFDLAIEAFEMDG